jgi:hypothetical protein
MKYFLKSKIKRGKELEKLLSVFSNIGICQVKWVMGNIWSPLWFLFVFTVEVRAACGLMSKLVIVMLLIT